MRVYHDLRCAPTGDRKPIMGKEYMRLTSVCGHLHVQVDMSPAMLERHGLNFYMNATETKLKTMIETILQKRA